MARLLPLALLALLAAGCAQPATTPTTTGPPPQPPLPTFTALGMPNVGGGEPNIAILPDGTLFIASPAGGAQKPNAAEGSAFLWKSTDHGRTWATLRSPNLAPQTQGTPAPREFCSCDADVTTSVDGWTYYADWWIAGLGPAGVTGPGNYIVEASPDAGKTWKATSVTIPENLLAAVDREWLVAGPDGFVGLFYSFFAPACVAVACVPQSPAPAFGLDRPGQAIEAVFSRDHGATWGDPLPVVPAPPPGSNDGYQIAHPFLAPNGTLMMPYGRVHSTNAGGFWYDDSEVRLAWSTDHGATWRDSLLARAPLGFDNLWAVQGAVDAKTGEATVVWAARDDGVKDGKVSKDSTMGLWVQQFGPLGAYGPTLVRGIGQNFLPWAAARNGTTVVGWYGGDATGDMMKAPPGSKWYAYAAVAPDGVFEHGSLVTPVSADPVKQGAICPKGAACNGNRELLDYVSMVLDADGRVHYAFTRSEGGRPHVAVANQD